MKGSDSSRILHGIFTYGLLSSFDWMLTPTYLIYLDPIIETYAYFRSMAFFHLVMSFGFLLGIVITTTRIQKMLFHFDTVMLILCPILFLLWTICSNPSMFVMVKLLQGTLLGYFSQNFPMIGNGNDHTCIVAHLIGSSTSIFLILICFQRTYSFRQSIILSGSLLTVFSLVINGLQGLLNVLKVSTRDVMRAPTNPLSSAMESPVPDELDSSSALAIPARYYRGCGAEAAERWRQTLQWRRDQRLDGLLAEEQPRFELMKRCYPSYFHGRSKTGAPVIYEQLGCIDIKRLKAEGIDKTTLLRHYLFHIEYLWQIIEPSEEGQAITVMDIKNVQVYDIIGEVLDFLKLASQTIQQHYVERCCKIFIVNTPFFFHMIWSVVSPLIHENTRRKITILGQDTSPLLDYIDVDVVPLQYGGRDTTPLGQHAMERELLSFVKAIQRNPSRTRRSEITREPIPSTSVRLPLPIDREALLLEQRSSRSDDVTDAESEDLLDWEQIAAYTRETVRAVHRFSLPLLNRFKPNKQEKIDPALDLMLSRDSSSQAHLGMENAFRYDPVSKRWKLEDEKLEALSSMDNSERDIIRAIEAAHERRLLGLDSTKDEWRKCDRHLVITLLVYFAWRAQLSSVISGLAAILPLAFEKGGFGMTMSSFAGIVVLSVIFQSAALAVPYLLRKLNVVDRDSGVRTEVIRAMSQFQGIAIGLITVFAVVNRSFDAAATTSTFAMAVSISVINLAYLCCNLGMNELFTLANISKEYLNIFRFSADSFGVILSFMLLSFVFGDIGVSKYNSYVALPFFLATVGLSFLTHYTMSENHHIYSNANYLVYNYGNK